MTRQISRDRLALLLVVVAVAANGYRLAGVLTAASAAALIEQVSGQLTRLLRSGIACRLAPTPSC